MEHCPQFHLPQSEIARCFELKDDAWQSKLLWATCPAHARIAVALGSKVAVFALSRPNNSTSSTAAAAHSKHALLGSATCPSEDSATALLWVAWHKSGGQQHNQASAKKYSTLDNPLYSRRASGSPSIHTTNNNSTSVQDPGGCLLVGTASGYIQLHDSRDGVVMLRQRLHTGGPVLRMQLRTSSMGFCSLDQSEDVTVAFSSAVVRVPSAALFRSLVSCNQARVHAEAAALEAKERTGSWAAAMAWAGSSAHGLHSALGSEVLPITPCQKWSLPRALGPRCDSLYLGVRAPLLYEVLQGAGAEDDDEGMDCQSADRVVLATAGEGPALAALDAPASASHRGSITALASSIYGLARNAHSQITSGPSHLRQGIKSFLLAPLLSFEPKKQPITTFDDPASATGQGEPTPVLWRCFRDDMRAVKALVPAPRGTMMAAVDNLGRILLLDTAAQFSVLRVLKGYRDATCGWVELPTHLVHSHLLTQHMAAHAQETVQQEPRRQQQDHRAQGADDEEQWQQQGQQAQETVQEESQWQRQQRLRRRSLRQSLRCAQGAHAAQAEGACATQSEGAGPAGSEDCPEAEHSQGLGGAGGDGHCLAASAGTSLVLIIHAPRRQAVEAWLPPYGPRLYLLHRPGSWVLEHTAPCFTSCSPQGAGTQCTEGSNEQDPARSSPGGMAEPKSHKRCDSVPSAFVGRQGGQADHCSMSGSNDSGSSSSSSGSLQGVHTNEETLKGACMSGCWLLDPATGLTLDLGSLLVLELGAAVQRAQAGV